SLLLPSGRLDVVQIEVVLPCFSVGGPIPMSVDGAAIGADPPLETLVQSWRVSPDPPKTILQSHAIDPRNTTPIGVQDSILWGRLVGAHEPACTRQSFSILMLYEEMTVFDPLEPRGPSNSGR